MKATPRPSLIAENDRNRAYAMGLALVMISVGNHAIMAALFFALDHLVLGTYQVFSTAFFLVMTFALRRFEAIALVWSLSLVEFGVAAAFGTIILGINVGFTLVVLVALGVFAPVRFAQMPTRILVFCLAGAITVGSATYANIVGPVDPVPVETTNWLQLITGMMIAPTGAVVIWFFMKEMWRAEAALEKEYARSERLLRNIMPAEVAKRLKDGEGLIADGHPHVTVLFADIVGFTQRSSIMTPEKLVALLNKIFSRFDTLVDERGVEKIKTIGDAYLAVSGLPSDRADPAEAIALLALDMLAACDAINRDLALDGHDAEASPVSVRIGIHTGAVVAGIIGTSKFAYDLWGDVVNTASRMESSGEAGRIQVSEAVHELLEGRFDMTLRGTVEVKGKGPMRTWFLERQISDAKTGRNPDQIGGSPE